MIRLEYRGRVLAGGLVTVLVLGLLGWAFAQVRSPRAVQAESAPPADTALYAPVEYRVLEQTVSGSGIVVPGRSYSSPEGAGGNDLIMTALPVHAGEEAKFGSVLAEVSGRPVILLKGSLPAYRDLAPGDSGPDVRQLQKALSDLALYRGSITGEYGPGTSEGVQRLYEHIGREALRIGDEALASAESAVRNAKRAVEETTAAFRQAKSLPTAERSAARRSARYAREDLALAEEQLRQQRSMTGATLPAAETLFVPKGPVTVADFGAALGGALSGPAVRVSVGKPLLQLEMPEAAALKIEPGQQARFVLDDGGVEGQGKVRSVGRETTGSQDADEAAPSDTVRAILIKPADVLPAAAVGGTASVVVVTQTTDQAVLSVPITALRYEDAVTATLVLEDGQSVPTTVGLVADGYAQIFAARGRVHSATRVRVFADASGDDSSLELSVGPP